MDLYSFTECRLCPRRCGADRFTAGGACRTKLKYEDGRVLFPVARAALHYWEEPCISGSTGSGTVFFTGCNLGCVFCQNGAISTGESGIYIDSERLVRIFFELKEQGAANINLVTAAHVLPPVREAVAWAKEEGLDIPVLYNTSSYELREQIRSLEGLADIYLPDLKYSSTLLAKRFSHAEDYPQVARAAIEEMVRQTGPCVFDKNGMLRRGTVVRHLVLPGCSADSKEIIRYLYTTYGDDIYISIMNQYTPVERTVDIPPLNRAVRASEYDSVIEYALSIGVKNAYMQEGSAADESFIPPFDHTGVLPGGN